jgi:hypothetical protein
MFGTRRFVGNSVRLTWIVVICAATSIATSAQAEIISATLMLSGENALTATLGDGGGFVPPGLSAVANATGSVAVSLTMEFDPVTQQPTAITGLSFTGGSWSVNDLFFDNSDPLYPPVGPYAQAIGIGGTIGSHAVSVVVDKSFPAEDHFLEINTGTAELYDADTGQWFLIQNYADPGSSARCDLTSGTGTVSVSLASLIGNTATYDVAGTLPVHGGFPVGFVGAMVNLDGTLEMGAQGSFVRTVPEPTGLTLFTLASVGSLAFWVKRRRVAGR